MTAPRFFLPSVDRDRLTIESDDARHAVRSLRIRVGETITISDGAGVVATATVVSAEERLVADVTGRTTVPRPRPRLTVYQSIPKQGHLHEITDALTQLGVDEIVLVAAKRSVPRWDAAKAQKHVERLRVIVREAAMQSRRAWLTQIGDLIASGDIPAGTIILHEEATPRLQDALPDRAPDRVALAVGPEGGFDQDEVAAASERGCPVAGLGPLVLRTELAAVVAAALVMSRYGRLG